MSNPSDEDWKRMIKLIDSFSARQDAEPFRTPVPWKTLGLVDYPQIIKNPMDFGTVKDKMSKNKYKTLYQVAEDVRLIWGNCMTYNADGSDFYKLAENLQKKWDDKYSKLLQDLGTLKDAANGAGGDAEGGSGSAGKASIADRKNFAKSLFQISKEDLGKVLVDVEAKCPAAIKRNATEDEVEFNIDEIPGSLLQELTVFVTSVKGKKKKQAASGGTNKKVKASN